MSRQIRKLYLQHKINPIDVSRAKAKELIDKYPNILMGDSSLGLKEIALTEEMKKILCNNTNLNIIQNG